MATVRAREGTAPRQWPNFFVIGANRAGTTSLHEYLSQHPDVFMSAVKEPNYFAPKSEEDEQRWPSQQTPVQLLDDYRALFASVQGETAVGESSTAYLSHVGAPALIHQSVPEAKLVAVLRHPVDRAFSDHQLHVRWGRERLSFADAVAAELDHEGPVDGRLRGYVMTGFYGRSLTRYLEHFDRARLGVWLYEDLVSAPAALVADVLGFLGVDPTVAVDTTARRNASPLQPRSRRADRVVHGAFGRIAARTLPASARARAREFVRRTNGVAPQIPEQVRSRLIELYRPDVERTQSIVDRDLSAWLT